MTYHNRLPECAVCKALPCIVSSNVPLLNSKRTRV